MKGFKNNICKKNENIFLNVSRLKKENQQACNRKGQTVCLMKEQL